MRADLSVTGCRMIGFGMLGNIHRSEDKINTTLISIWKLRSFSQRLVYLSLSQKQVHLGCVLYLAHVLLIKPFTKTHSGSTSSSVQAS